MSSAPAIITQERSSRKRLAYGRRQKLAQLRRALPWLGAVSLMPAFTNPDYDSQEKLIATAVVVGIVALGWWGLAEKKKTEQRRTKNSTALPRLKRAHIIEAIGLASFILAGWASSSYFFPHLREWFSANEVDRRLTELSNELNRTLPKTLDRYTTLETTKASGSELTYIYRLHGGASFDGEMTEQLRTRACKASETKRMVKDWKITLHYRYFDERNRVVGDFAVRPGDCR